MDEWVEKIAKNVQAITQRITTAAVTSGRDPQEIQLVVVTKGQPVDVVEAAWTAKSARMTSFISAQNRHNVLECRISPQLAAACARHGLGFLPFYPLAAGLLTGKYRPGEPPAPGTRLSVPNRFYDGILNEANFARLAKLEDFARERGRSILELAIGWLASQPIVSSVICGATRPEQVEANVRASGWRLSADEMKSIDALVDLR